MEGKGKTALVVDGCRINVNMKSMRPGPSGFSQYSTAEQSTHGIDASGLTSHCYMYPSSKNQGNQGLDVEILDLIQLWSIGFCGSDDDFFCTLVIKCIKKDLNAINCGDQGGIGHETARVLACVGHMSLWGVRNMAAGKQVQEGNRQEIPTPKVEGKGVGFLVLGIRIMMTPFMLSKDNIELQFCPPSNLGHFLLTHLLLDNMNENGTKSKKEGGFVNVSSEAHRDYLS
ncbi:hypothetical protein OSB04_un001580 [Centaurea solstitialis]|uniref:Uncharacterized protein n=1 Tax=Centaurea solstitialis TaxID=347529 RepID=A0AA38W4W5_9ASTR|nr:hypothetical protein OSB04_un001580 [Centaurea solstitialis]